MPAVGGHGGAQVGDAVALLSPPWRAAPRAHVRARADAQSRGRGAGARLELGRAGEVGAGARRAVRGHRQAPSAAAVSADDAAAVVRSADAALTQAWSEAPRGGGVPRGFVHELHGAR